MTNIPAYIKYKVIFQDWDYEKNVIPITEINKTSKIKTWWKCKNNHSYEVSVFSRIRSEGCKICNKPNKAAKFRKVLLKKGISFALAQPHLLSEWDKDKNVIKPSELSEKSSVKVWFKCSKNHEWESSPKRRSRGDGCPECYKAIDKSKLVREQKLKKKGTNLEEEYPELVKEWDYSKNRELPSAYSSGSNEKVSWKCNFGHFWKATIYNRTGNSSDCPYCKSSTSKLEVFILTEMRGLFDEVKWRHKIDGYECDIYMPEIKTGIEVDGAYWHDDKIERDKLKFKIFKEHGIRLLRVRDNSLPTIKGEVVLYNKTTEYVDLSCEVVKYLMKGQKKDAFTNYIEDHVQIGIKEYKKILSLLPAPTKEKSLAELNSELSNEWDYTKNVPLTPFMFTPNSEKKVFWNCSKGHSWEASIKNRHKRKSGCPVCYRNNAGSILRKALLNKKGISLDISHPELLKEWDFKLNKFEPSELSSGSSVKAHWVCKAGHKWQSSVNGRTAKSYGCPVCMNNTRSERATIVRIKKSGTFAEKYPELLKEWDYKRNKNTPDSYPPGSKKRVSWVCDKGHNWEAIIRNRSAGKGKCPTCKSIIITNPELLKEWDYKKNVDTEPSLIKSGSNKKIWWLCENGHSYQQNTYEKLKGHQGCSICRKRK